ncbi:unnamed protein product [Vitrella brassicaformis CCMP3155]|uniref:Uncharacterized protein n=1 Tax=Vitrella brassicaformis (strain CCMP3155) TaxID=1169540 RepID=A0A0G4GZ73_VITBC|nr:unnamed protein product [Vitrella brassicaformis CCMP3155]|mmetsp:Transcript_33272/g.96060  ORF Transcript_33272/g.96060 Transcript_33272/m.96060 type:complete len:351 (+) Transcript_33272:73-1125(+)|eukprot:CEM36376.1 unnamed protein product [Vitrella brassicaformis CCMP3155]
MHDSFIGTADASPFDETLALRALNRDVASLLSSAYYRHRLHRSNRLSAPIAFSVKNSPSHMKACCLAEKGGPWARWRQLVQLVGEEVIWVTDDDDIARFGSFREYRALPEALAQLRLFGPHVTERDLVHFGVDVTPSSPPLSPSPSSFRFAHAAAHELDRLLFEVVRPSSTSAPSGPVQWSLDATRKTVNMDGRRSVQFSVEADPPVSCQHGRFRATFGSLSRMVCVAYVASRMRRGGGTRMRGHLNGASPTDFARALAHTDSEDKLASIETATLPPLYMPLPSRVCWLLSNDHGQGGERALVVFTASDRVLPLCEVYVGAGDDGGWVRGALERRMGSLLGCEGVTAVLA